MALMLQEASFSAVPIQEASDDSPKGIWRIRLIEADVQGSSGFYPAETLRRDGPNAFPSGTHIFFDHPAESEQWDRPERSVRDLAGHFIEDAHYEDGPDGKGLFARVQLFPDVHQWMETRKESIGMSIRANGIAADTEEGRTITALTEGVSVDIVTRAGAGGKVLQLMESGRNNAPSNGGAPGVDVSALAAQVKGLADGQKTLNEAVTGLVSVLKESVAKPANEEKSEGLNVAQIVAKLDEADLPPVCRKRLAEAYKAGDDFDAMIKAEKEYADQVMEASKPKKVTRNVSKDGKDDVLNTGVLEESGFDNISKELDSVIKLLGLEG